MVSKADLQSLSRLIGNYDLRARFPQELDEAGGEVLGNALGPLMGGSVLIGRDTRRESARIERSLAKGLREVGTHAIRVGILPTPVLAFAARQWQVPALMVTPSHNPIGEVGVKALTREGELWTNEWERLRRRLRQGSIFHKTIATLPASESEAAGCNRRALESKYIASIQDLGRSNLKVALDPRGGATAGWARRSMEAMGMSVVSIHDRYSPTFFGCSPEPSVESSKDLSNLVLDSSADFGVTFDGDGDRALFLDHNGKGVSPEAIALTLYENQHRKVGPIVASSDASPKVRLFARVIPAAVGSRNIVDKMKKVHAGVGFELSNHFYLRDTGFVSDGITVSCKVALALRNDVYSLKKNERKLAIRNRVTLSQLLERRLNFQELIKALKSDRKYSWSRHVDGFLHTGQNGELIFLRASNTELRLRIVTEDLTAESRDYLLRVLREKFEKGTIGHA